jgi:hypothetical protein
MWGSWVFMLWKKGYDHIMSQTPRKATTNSHRNQTHEKHESEAGEPFCDSSHVSRATRVHQPHVLQSSVQHLHRTRRGWWLSVGGSEKNLRDPALNYATWESLHNLLYITIWTRGTRTMMRKTWTVQVSRLKTCVRSSYRKTMCTRETITTMRTWPVTIGGHKTSISCTNMSGKCME